MQVSLNKREMYHRDSGSCQGIQGYECAWSSGPTRNCSSRVSAFCLSIHLFLSLHLYFPLSLSMILLSLYALLFPKQGLSHLQHADCMLYLQWWERNRVSQLRLQISHGGAFWVAEIGWSAYLWWIHREEGNGDDQVYACQLGETIIPSYPLKHWFRSAMKWFCRYD